MTTSPRRASQLGSPHNDKGKEQNGEGRRQTCSRCCVKKACMCFGKESEREGTQRDATSPTYKNNHLQGPRAGRCS